MHGDLLTPGALSLDTLDVTVGSRDATDAGVTKLVVDETTLGETVVTVQAT